MPKRPEKTRVRHGMPSCADYGCTRSECRKAAALARKANKKESEQGNGTKTSATDARNYLKVLVHAGMPLRDVAVIAGLSFHTVTDVEAKRVTTIHRDTSDAILGVPLPESGYKPQYKGWICSTYARWRVRHLCCQGFTSDLIAMESDISSGAVSVIRRGNRDKVEVSVHRNIMDAYDRLNGVNPVSLGVLPWAAEKAKAYAIEQGWDVHQSRRDRKVLDAAAKVVGIRPVAHS